MVQFREIPAIAQLRDHKEGIFLFEVLLKVLMRDLIAAMFRKFPVQPKGLKHLADILKNRECDWMKSTEIERPEIISQGS